MPKGPEEHKRNWRPRAVWYEMEDDSADNPNLEYMDIKKMKEEWRSRQAEGPEGIGRRLIEGAAREVTPCNHNYGGGLVHFWGNPKMINPCQLTRIDGKWYRRKSCEIVPPTEEWNDAEEE